MKLIKNVLIILFSFLCFGLGAWFYLATNYCVDLSVLERYEPGKPTLVLDEQGHEWARFQLDRREPISIQHMPEHLINAFLAAEDWQFFSHHGISWKGIARSVFVNLYHRRKVQGASTITQQLVKLLFFDSSKTFSRKIKEQIYALIVEQQFSKQQILEVYLNHVYFGCGIYGVEAACKRFWNISATDISIDQAASLAAIIRNPSQYCPLLCPTANEHRRNLIVHTMAKLTFISHDQCLQAVTTQVRVEPEEAHCCAPHLKEDLRLFLENLVGKKELYTGGLRVQTTLNSDMQRTADHEFKKHCATVSGDLKKNIDGGLIVLEVKTGEMRAVVGGVDFKQSQFNRAFQAKRQIGSIFKPLIYAAALEKGLSFADIELDEPMQITQSGSIWSPKNYNKKFNGMITRAYALSHSNNIVAIKTLLEVGIDSVIDVAKRCHLPGPFFPYPSLALGCVDATLKESVGMFNIFANDGVYVTPHYVSWVKDKWGKKIFKATVAHERVLSSRVNSQVAKVLELGLKRVQQWFADQWIDCDAISKTGTTNDSRTCWYIGSTPTLTTALYVGCDDNSSLGSNIYPIRTAFPIWLAFNRSIPNSVKKFSYDPTLQKILINERTGRKTKPYDDEAIEIVV